jgi:hypothetical protein
VMVNKKNDCLHFCCVSAVMVCLIFQNGRFIQIESETFTRREFADVSSSHFFLRWDSTFVRFCDYEFVLANRFEILFPRALDQ